MHQWTLEDEDRTCEWNAMDPREARGSTCQSAKNARMQNTWKCKTCEIMHVRDVETQVSMGAYRPYCKTLYWSCWRAATFANFAFSRFCAFRIFAHITHFAFSHISHISHSHVFRTFHVSDSSRFRASHELCTSRVPTQFAICTLAYLVGFAFSCILRISHSHVFRASTCATARLPGIHRIPFTCPVLILQGPLMHISLCFTRIPSYMSLHSHLCSFISLCVYITSPLYV